jgi:hypothetical protein
MRVKEEIIIEDGYHFAHCNDGENQGYCKYGETETCPAMGYHMSPIDKGVFGMPSKIAEELAEFQDALRQGNEIMAIHELSDLYGAIEAYLKAHHPSITIDHLRIMSDATKRAFRSGERR